MLHRICVQYGEYQKSEDFREVVFPRWDQKISWISCPHYLNLNTTLETHTPVIWGHIGCGVLWKRDRRELLMAFGRLERKMID
jgi:hypothetical protein